MSVASMLADSGYSALKDYVVRQTGLSYYADKDEDFAMRLARRFTSRGVTDCSDYLQMLTDARWGRQEMDHLVGELTIGETYFFRHKEQFELIRGTIVPDLLERNKETRSLRIWSAGCATGAEPYSLSILLRSEFQNQLSGWNVSIVATDLNLDFLERARAARFPNWALRDTSEGMKARCFLHDGNNWLLRPEFTKDVTFQYHNLAAGQDLAAGSGTFDLILCRNVIIYFSREQAIATLNLLQRHLVPQGWLLVGYAEPNMQMFKAFETVTNGDTTAYRNPGGEKTAVAGSVPWLPWIDPVRLAAVLAKPHEAPSLLLRQSMPVAQAPARTPEEARSAPRVDDVRTLADVGRWDAAASLTEKLTQSDPLNPGGHFVSALIYEHMGATDKALTALRRAVYLDRRFALAHYHLGTALMSARQTESASRSFRNTLEVLADMADDEPLPHGDSITAGELRTLANMHLQMRAR